MSEYLIIYPDELYHHGIKGMHWGVHRFQNYDGTYTQQGLKRYSEYENAYKKADKKVKTLKAKRRDDRSSVSKSSISKAKAERSSAKRSLSKSYDRLKLDNKADKGKILYQKGRTIGKNAEAVETRRKVLAGSTAFMNALLYQIGATKETAIPANLVAAGLTAVNELYGVKVRSDDSKMRAYWHHGGRR